MKQKSLLMEEIDLSSRNSFLNSTDRNSCIPSDIRNEIDNKYNNSIVNKNYIFPRTKAESQEIMKNDSCLLDKKLKRLVIKRQKTGSFNLPVIQSLNKLPDIKRKINLSINSKKRIDRKFLNASCHSSVKLKEIKPRVVNLSKKRIQFKNKQICNKVMFNEV